MQLLISDANILIDIEEGELIEQMFRLPYQFAIPDILYYEELEGQHNYLLAKGLQLADLNENTMRYAEEIIQRYPKPSRNDCFALALAQNIKCPLLTGDKDLKKAAEKEAVIVMGTLWVVERIVRMQLITVDQARGAYRKMKEASRRLPWDMAEAGLVNIQNDMENNH